MFVYEGQSDFEILIMFGVLCYFIFSVVEKVCEIQGFDIFVVILFGIFDVKDEVGIQVYVDEGVVQWVMWVIKEVLFDFVVIVDICLCEYISYGYCGYLYEVSGQWIVDNDLMLELLVQIVVLQVCVGVDIIVLSVMMDGQVVVICVVFDGVGFVYILVMSYVVKYVSVYYGFFCEVVGSVLSKGDCVSYQMDLVGGYCEVLCEVWFDVEQGVDYLMVKFIFVYLDVMWMVCDVFDLLMIVYNVSGEYLFIKVVVQFGYIDECCIVFEILIGMVCVGVDVIIIYYVLDVVCWLWES